MDSLQQYGWKGGREPYPAESRECIDCGWLVRDPKMMGTRGERGFCACETRWMFVGVHDSADLCGDFEAGE